MKQLTIKTSMMTMLLVTTLPLAGYAGTHTIYPGFKQELTIEPFQSQRISNPFFWSMKLTCQVTSNVSPMRLKVELIKKSGRVDGTQLKQGQSIEIPLNYHQQFKIEASANAQVDIISLSNQSISATCNT